LLNLPKYLSSTSSIWMFLLYVCLYGCLFLVNVEEKNLLKYPCCKVLASFVPHLSYEILLNLKVVGQKCDSWVFAWNIISLCLCPMFILLITLAYYALCSIYKQKVLVTFQKVQAASILKQVVVREAFFKVRSYLSLISPFLYLIFSCYRWGL